MATGKAATAISLDVAKEIYRKAIDPRVTDGEGATWWHGVADEIRDVVAARSQNEAAEVVDWWHHDWTAVSDTARGAAKRIREAARAMRLHAQENQA